MKFLSRVARVQRALVCACLCSLVLQPLPVAAAGEVLEGVVVTVHDGDTLSVDVESRTVKVRLAGIDTPERGQPWAQEARQALLRRTLGKWVRINQVDIDRYGRTVGEVYADDVCVGCELVRGGHAWVYRKYSDDPVLLALEREAQIAERGVWALPEARRVPPWQWREARRKSGVASPALPAKPADSRCEAHPRCGDLQNCEQARFFLEVCGLTRLDFDRDGVPCEGLCR